MMAIFLKQFCLRAEGVTCTKAKASGLALGPILIFLSIFALWKNQGRFVYYRAAKNTPLFHWAMDADLEIPRGLYKFVRWSDDGPAHCRNLCLEPRWKQKKFVLDHAVDGETSKEQTQWWFSPKSVIPRFHNWSLPSRRIDDSSRQNLLFDDSIELSQTKRIKHALSGIGDVFPWRSSPESHAPFNNLFDSTTPDGPCTSTTFAWGSTVVALLP